MSDIQKDINAPFVSHSMMVGSCGEQIERAKKNFLSRCIRARKRLGDQSVISYLLERLI